MTQESKLYVAGRSADDATYWLLHLEPKTLGEADRAIRWQQIGQGEGSVWYLLTKDYERQTMLLDGEPVSTSREPYTEKAWADFWERKI